MCLMCLSTVKAISYLTDEIEEQLHLNFGTHYYLVF